MRRKLLTHLLVLVGGFFLGWTLGGRGRPAPARAELPSQAAVAATTPVPAAEKLRSALAQTEVAAREEAGPSDRGSDEPSYFEAMRKLDEAQRKHWLDIILNPVTPDGRLTRGAIALFELNEQQTAALEDTMKLAKQRIDALEQSVASVKVGADGREVTISIPAYASQAGEIYDDVFRAFAAVLGPDRYSVFEAAATPQLESTFRQFGERERTITITRSDKADDDYEIRDAQKFAGGFSSSSLSGKKADILKQLGPSIQKLVPNEF